MSRENTLLSKVTWGKSPPTKYTCYLSWSLISDFPGKAPTWHVLFENLEGKYLVVVTQRGGSLPSESGLNQHPGAGGTQCRWRCCVLGESLKPTLHLLWSLQIPEHSLYSARLSPCSPCQTYRWAILLKEIPSPVSLAVALSSCPAISSAALFPSTEHLQHCFAVLLRFNWGWCSDSWMRVWSCSLAESKLLF